MIRRYKGQSTALCVVVILFAGIVQAQSPAPKADTKVQSLLERAYIVHGGSALTKLRTLRAESEMTGSGPFGIRVPGLQNILLVDRGTASGLWKAYRSDKAGGIYRQTPAGIFVWTENAKTQKLREASESFDYVPPIKTGVLGLLALASTNDPLTYVEKGEIKGKKGPMIVRTQTPQETLLFLGKDGFARASCQTTWSYLFAPDGTLIAERIIQSQPKRTVEMEMSYDRFAVYGGIKLPTEGSLKTNQLPSSVHMKYRIKRIVVNEPIAASEFNAPE